MGKLLVTFGSHSMGFYLEGFNEALKTVSLIVSITVGAFTAVDVYRRVFRSKKNDEKEKNR